MTGCDDCEYRNDCIIREEYLNAERLHEEEDIDGLRKICNIIELHEQYIVEMRRDVNSKLVDLIKKKSSNIKF